MFSESIIEQAEQIIADAKRIKVADGEALYLVGTEVILGKDGCQPSNSMGLCVGPTDDEDWSELQYAVSMELQRKSDPR